MGEYRESVLNAIASWQSGSGQGLPLDSVLNAAYLVTRAHGLSLVDVRVTDTGVDSGTLQSAFDELVADGWVDRFTEGGEPVVAVSPSLRWEADEPLIRDLARQAGECASDVLSIAVLQAAHVEDVGATAELWGVPAETADLGRELGRAVGA